MAVALLPLMDGESIPSNLGRYAEYMGITSTDKFRARLFGYFYSASTRLPSAIDYLAEQTRHYWGLTGKQIVFKHTEFHYVTMMSSEATRERLLQRMLFRPSGENGSPRILRFDGERLKNLRYCPECLSKWRSERSPIYWKMDHQLVGVYVCAEHLCALKTVEFGRIESHGNIPVLNLTKDTDLPIICDSARTCRIAIEEVGKRSARQRREGGGGRPIGIYRDLLRDAGFSRAGSLVRQNEAIYAWTEFFGKEYCNMTGMSAARISAWISSLTGHKGYETPHPFMFIAADSFLEHVVYSQGSYLPAAQRKLQDGEAICTGVKCEGALHRDSDVVNFAGALRRSGGWKLECTCGISYRMPHLAQSAVGKPTPFSYGGRYRKKFDALLKKGVSACRASRELGLSHSTALSWRRSRNSKKKMTLTQREVRKLRTEWRQLVKSACSDRRISSAAGAKPDVYRALLECDRDWLVAFNSKHRSWRPRSSYKVHEPTTSDIRKAWQELLMEEPPVRSTASSLCAKLEFWGTRDRNTPGSRLLAELTESRSAYRERAVSWLVKLAAENRLTNCGEALRRTGIRQRSLTREQRNRIREINAFAVGTDV